MRSPSALLSSTSVTALPAISNKTSARIESPSLHEPDRAVFSFLALLNANAKSKSCLIYFNGFIHSRHDKHRSVYP